ncbi:MAG: penicillin acylase family protein [Acidobacteria bacterium]|nr:penicillin acylase family protein [Acidobacteriota bacterium]
MSPRAFVSIFATVVITAGSALSVHAQAQPPQTVELDAATIAVRAEAAQRLVPLLKDVRNRATGRYNVQTGGAPNSPITGQQSTLFSVTVGKRDSVVAPEVLAAMDELMKWRAGDRSSPKEAALFDAWLEELSRKATALQLATTGGACDTGCVVKTMTELNTTWGESPRTRAELRDQALLEALTEAVKARK